MTINNPTGAIATQSHTPRRGWWVAALGDPTAVQAATSGSGSSRCLRTVIGDGSHAPPFCLLAENEAALPAFAADDDCGVVFDGVLYNQIEVRGQLGSIPASPTNDAGLILRAYRRWGDDVLTKLKGVFALVIWDRRSDTLLCARDPMGIFPLFFAGTEHCTLFSISSEALVQRPGVSAEVNRGLLAAWFARLFSADSGETFYSAVRRVPMGHAMRLSGVRRVTYRYWDPAPPNRPINWVREDELGQFDVLLDQAVRRCLAAGTAGIFLSGGLDSVSVAAVAVQQNRESLLLPPLALSLVFPHPEANEEPIQRRVAEILGLTQVLLPLEEATGPSGVLETAIERSAGLSAPLQSPWYSAYERLMSEAERRGCRVILTGSGGDEWLTVGPEHAADLIRVLDFKGLFRFWQNLRGSYGRPSLPVMRSVFWSFSARPLLRNTIASMLVRVRPDAMHARRLRRAAQGIPSWLAPDPELRRDLLRRAEQEFRPPVTKGFLMDATRRTLDHLLVSLELEEAFERGRRTGMLQLSPYWDPDLVDFLYRTPARLLNRGGRSKGLVRETVDARFPEVGFERQKKVVASSYLRDLLSREGPIAWRLMGGAQSLGALGVVDAAALAASAQGRFTGPDIGEAYRMWEILLHEAWVRPRV